jgi:hypothetical protein
MVMLPKATYTTDASGCASSHLMHRSSSGRKCPTGFRNAGSANSGPMGRMLGKRLNAPASASWKELLTTISASSFSLLLRVTSSKMMCCPSGSPALFHDSCDECSGGIPGASWNVSCRTGNPAQTHGHVRID